ncbi:UDP-N-acetyl-D-mannosaminuronic acid transferase [Spirochaetia bacterium]|nr:UDP-N-acetyl-D-mannosaminuronic acid transferase [Spirochaetia bacterium]
MKHTVKLFGLEIYTNGKEQLLEDIKERNGKTHIISGSGWVLKFPLNDENRYRLFSGKENIIIPDALSVYFPIKRKMKDAKKIIGIEFMDFLLNYYQDTDKSVYFLGAKESVIEIFINVVKKSYPKLKIAGYRDGYFDINSCNDVIRKIKDSQASILFVGLGAPVQEDFIFRYMYELPCELFMGVGGSFDVLSGSIKRSPQWMNYLHLEWLYRMVQDPSKIDRTWDYVFCLIKGLFDNT